LAHDTWYKGLFKMLDILEFRKGMWAAVAGRLHTAVRIYPFGSGSSEVMLYGTVEYTFKDGKKVTVSMFIVIQLQKLTPPR